MRNLFLRSVALIAFGVSVAANAADMAVKAPPSEPLYNWSGPYVGANFGGAWTSGSLNIPNNNFYGGLTEFIGGVQAGYNVQAGHFLFGVEGDFDGATFGHPALPTPTLGSVSQNWIGTIAGRVGLVEDRWLVYAKLGGGWVHSNAVLNFPGVSWIGSNTSSGWLAGVGLEYGFKSHWTIKLEYDQITLGNWTSATVPSNPVEPRPSNGQVRCNYKFESGASEAVARTAAPVLLSLRRKTKTWRRNHRTLSPISSAFRSKATRISTLGRSTALRKCLTFSQSCRCTSTQTGT